MEVIFTTIKMDNIFLFFFILILGYIACASWSDYPLVSILIGLMFLGILATDKKSIKA